MPADDLDEILRSLRQHYAGELPERMRAIDEALATGDPQTRSLVHRLHGSAGSYGFLDVSRAAGHLEEALEAADPEVIARAHTELRDIVKDALAVS